MGNCQNCLVKRLDAEEFTPNNAQVFSNFKECAAAQHYLVQQQLLVLQNRYQLQIFNYTDLVFDQVLGQSENWTTFQGYYRQRPVAIRVRWIDYTKINNCELRILEFLQDIEKIQKIISQNPQYFVQIQGLSIDKIPIIVTEFMDQSDIQTFYKTYSLTVPQKIEMAVQICEAMSILHSYNNMSMVHGKLKPQNIVVNSGEQVKVCFLQTKETLIQGKEETNQPTTSNLFYTAPEILESNEPSQSNDI